MGAGRGGLALAFLRQALTLVDPPIIPWSSALFWCLAEESRTCKAMRAYSDNEDLAPALSRSFNLGRASCLAHLGDSRGALASNPIGAALRSTGSTRASARSTIFHAAASPIFAAAVVGGIGQPFGAIAGGFVVAFSEVSITYASQGGSLSHILPEEWDARRARPTAFHGLQIRRVVHHSRACAAGATERHLQGARDTPNYLWRTVETSNYRMPLLYAAHRRWR